MKSGVCNALNAQSLATLLAAQDPVKNDSRYENGGEEVRQQTKSQRGCEALYRAGAENKQDRRGKNGRDVRIKNGSPRMAEALSHSGRRRFAIPQFFANTLKNQHIGIYAHTDRENDSGNSRQRQHTFQVAHGAEQDDEVQNQSDIRINAGPA